MKKNPLGRLKFLLWTFVIFWAGCFIGSLWWNMVQVRHNTIKVAHTSARVAYEKDLVYRRWNAEQGGVYVPVSDKVKPNPYLKVPDRDIRTPSGKMLTLMNPAYMTREVHTLSHIAYGVKGHITSLNPIRPQNTPDSWEAGALAEFQQGKKEVFSLENDNGKDYFRLMSPLVTEKGCLKCHAVQGYKLGDIRGGISVSIPMAPLWEIERSYVKKLVLTHVLLFFIGLAGFGTLGYRLNRQMRKRITAENELWKTNELLEKVFSTVHFCIAFLDNDSNYIRVNRAYAENWGFTPDFFRGKSYFSLYPHAEKESIFRKVADTGKPFTVYAEPFEFPDQPERGIVYWDWTLHPVTNNDGNVDGLILALVDVTDAKKSELKLITQSEKLETLVDERTSELENSNRLLVHEIEERKHVQKEQELLHLRLRSLWNIASLVNTDFNTLCSRILSEMITMTQSEYGFYCIFDEDEKIIHDFSWSGSVITDGTALDELVKHNISNFGLLTEAVKEKKTLMINNYKEIDGIKNTQPEDQMPIKRMLMVPILLENRMAKLVVVANKPSDYIKDDARQLEAFATNIQIILERQKASDALAKSEERYRELVENTMDIIIRCDGHGRISFINHMAGKYLGMAPNACIGKNVVDFIYPEDRRHARAHILKAIARKNTGFTIEIRQISMTGEVYDIFWTINMYYDENGMFTGNSAIGRDITGYKRIQSELAKAKKLEATGIFAGGIAHDFNNLLHIILGNINMLKFDSVVDDDGRTMLSTAESAVYRARDLILKFITFSSGGNPVKSIVDIDHLINEVIEVVLSGSNIDCEVVRPEQLKPVEVDISQIRQVLVNIMENAKEAMMDGGTLRVISENTNADIENSVHKLDLSPGTYVKVVVSDNGIGIARKYLEQIFDPYFSTKARGKEKGMGLGLSIVHSIIRKHNGYIHIESELKKGTDVIIYLPVTEKRLTMIPEEKEHGLQGGISRILLMDDEEQIRTLSKQILNKLGYDVTLASHGKDAIKQYQSAMISERPFDLVILDLTIKGGLGGVETLDKLKELDPDVQGIIISGYSSDPVMSNFRNYGFIASMTKPISFVKLKETLDKL